MATQSFQPLPCFWQNTASSKSRASSPSIVTNGKSRKSTRPRLASSGTSSAHFLSCFSTALGKLWGISCLRMAISTSMPFAILSPSTSVILPIGWKNGAVRGWSSTTTTCPIRAPRRALSGIKISRVMRLSSGTT